jgi:hypothetical protein
MQHEHHLILTIMSDGAHRSFDAIQIMAQMDSVTLLAALDGMISEGLLDTDNARGYEAYVITLRGLVDKKNSSPPPLYRP